MSYEKKRKKNSLLIPKRTFNTKDKEVWKKNKSIN